MHIRKSVLVLLLAAALWGAVVGCMSPSVGSEAGRDAWEAGHKAESAGDVETAVSSYLAAASRGLKIAQYDAGRLLIGLKDSPSRQRQGVELLEQCANMEASGFYFVQRDSEAAKFAALTELAALFESGRMVGADPGVAGYLYRLADAEQRNLSRWFSERKADRNVAAVFGARAASGAGLVRMEKRGYAGEKFDWPEIRARLVSDSGGTAGKKRSLRYQIASSSFDEKTATAIFEYDILEGDYDLETDRRIVAEMCRKVKSEFCDRHPEIDPGDVYAAPKSYSSLGKRVSYVVSVFWLKPTELTYSAATKQGVLLIRTDGRNLAEAQSWARKNIEPLVSSQNVALKVGERPPQGAHFKILDTALVDGGSRLRVSFATLD